MPRLGDGRPQIDAVCPSNGRDLAVCGRCGGTGPAPVSAAGRGGNLAPSVRPSPGAATRPGDLELPTLERFKNLHGATSCVVGSRLGAVGRAAMCFHQVLCATWLTEASASGALRGRDRQLSRSQGVWKALRCPPPATGPSRFWSTGRATPRPQAGCRRLAGPASPGIIGLGLSGSARRRGTARPCGTTAFTGQFPRSAMVSTKTTREEEERAF